MYFSSKVRQMWCTLGARKKLGLSDMVLLKMKNCSKIAEFLHVSIISITKEHILFLKQNGGTESIPNFSLFP